MKILVKLIATICILFLTPLWAFANSDSTRIGATIKISVCGDNIVEGEEECESGLGITYDCKDFGYASKKIQCDISCAYDLLSCPNINTSKPDTSDEEDDKVNTEPQLPTLIIGWDQDNDGVLTFKEFSTFIKTWVDSWRSFTVIPEEDNEKDVVAKECDINSDESCDVKDFSIILYYLNSND